MRILFKRVTEFMIRFHFGLLQQEHSRMCWHSPQKEVCWIIVVPGEKGRHEALPVRAPLVGALVTCGDAQDRERGSDPEQFQSLVARVVPILLPGDRVVLDVLPERFEFPFIADNPFEIVSMPKSSAVRRPAIVSDSLAVEMSCQRFESLHNVWERRRRLLESLVIAGTQNDDPMYVIWHDDKRVEFKIGKVMG